MYAEVRKFRMSAHLFLGYHMIWPSRKLISRYGRRPRSKPAFLPVPFPCDPGAALGLELSTRCGPGRSRELDPACGNPAHAGRGHPAPPTSGDHCARHRDFPPLLHRPTRWKCSDLCSPGMVLCVRRRVIEKLVSAKGPQDVSAASLFTTAKISAYPQTPRALLNAYHHILTLPPPRFQSSPSEAADKPEREIHHLSEDGYISARTTLLETESIILRTLGFNTKVILPHRLALIYLQTLGVLPRIPSPESKALTCRTLAHLNTALFSPQLLYVTHQPYTLAVAAIYLAARETGVKLTEWDWWEIFDVDREDLGFLVVGLQSCEAWLLAENEKWAVADCPLTVTELEGEMKRRGNLENHTRKELRNH